MHILSWIGGPHIIGLLQTAIRHPDARVKQEVIAALGTVEPRLARPLLLRMLDGGDTRRDYYVVKTGSGQRAWAYRGVGETDTPFMLHGWFA